MPDLYIVTPTWNCGNELLRLVDSLNSHADVLPTRWVIVENGSQDDERALVQLAVGRSWRIPVAAYLTNQKNLGCYVANNQALDWIAVNAEGPHHVVMLDADTEIREAHWLSRLVEFVERNPRCGIVGGARSPSGKARPIFYNGSQRWYVRDEMGDDDAPGEGVDLSVALLRWELHERGLRFDEGYEIYDGADEDLMWRVRSWGYEIWCRHDVGVVHYGSAPMKKSGYRWGGGGSDEWGVLRQRNRDRMVSIWGQWMASPRPDVKAEMEHLERMNARLVAEAGDRKNVPPHTVRIASSDERGM